MHFIGFDFKDSIAKKIFKVFLSSSDGFTIFDQIKLNLYYTVKEVTVLLSLKVLYWNKHSKNTIFDPFLNLIHSGLWIRLLFIQINDKFAGPESWFCNKFKVFSLRRKRALLSAIVLLRGNWFPVNTALAELEKAGNHCLRLNLFISKLFSTIFAGIIFHSTTWNLFSSF